MSRMDDRIDILSLALVHLTRNDSFIERAATRDFVDAWRAHATMKNQELLVAFFEGTRTVASVIHVLDEGLGDGAPNIGRPSGAR
jgi:hypothetical protein